MDAAPQKEVDYAALPYRAGLYVSHCDTTGGWTAQDEELTTLGAALRRVAQEGELPPFSQAILEDTLARRGHWPAWSQDLAAVPGECAAAATLLAAIQSEEEVEAFKHMLLDVAIAVAMAYREEREAAETQTPPPATPGFWDRLKAVFAPPKPKDRPLFAHANISTAEREALEKLSKALGVTL